ncbi:MAG: YceD family protein, partial [Actinomycetota bacterium]
MTFDGIDLADLIGHPGAFREVSVTGALQDLGTEVARVREDVPVGGALLLESVVEGILVSGRLEGVLALRCARCLEELDRPFQVEVHELYVERPGPDGDEYELGPDRTLDPDHMIRDAIGLELPFSPLCRDGCRGLCDVCGGDRNLGQCPGHEQ